MKKKYKFTPETDELIKRVYRDMTGYGEVAALAESLGLPRWKVTRRAGEIGAREPSIKAPEWTEAELKILKRNAQKTPEIIRKHLKKHGYTRSAVGIMLKRKRLELIKNLNGYTANNLAECFGVNRSTTVRWIKLGYLKAKRRETARVEAQGGDMWWIKEKDIKDFIKESIGIIDIRKVDKFWFVDILCGGLNFELQEKTGRACESEGEAIYRLCL